MTEFGDEVKNIVSSFRGDGLNSIVPVKKETKTHTYAYSFKVSGRDMIATYLIDGKEDSKFIMLFSQTDENGYPIAFIQKKKNNLICDRTTLRSFFAGLAKKEYKEDFADVVDDKTGELYEFMPKIHKSKSNKDTRFIDSVLFMLHNKKFIEHLKLGIINLEILYNYVEYREGRDGTKYLPPWFFANQDEYGYHIEDIEEVYTRQCKRVFNEEKGEFEESPEETYPNLLENNIHLKLYRAGMKMMMDRDPSLTKTQFLYSFYSPYGNVVANGCKAFTRKLFNTFMVLANRYDEPYAIRCMEQYMLDKDLSSLAADKLDKFFRINAKAYTQRVGRVRSNDRYSYGHDYTVIPGSLVRGPIQEASKQYLLNLDKNRFWDYLVYLKTVGFGDMLDECITNLMDYYTACLSYEGKVDDRYPDHLIESHHIMMKKYNDLKNFEKVDRLKIMGEIGAKYCDMTVDGYTLRTFTVVEDFLNEASYMGNCLASSDYAGLVADGVYWICTFRKEDDPDTPIMDVEITHPSDKHPDLRGKMTQIKARFNHYPEQDNLVTEMKALKKMQDKIYKKLVDDGLLTGPNGYGKEFNFIRIPNNNPDQQD